MIIEMKKIVKAKVFAYKPKDSECITYTGIEAVARALGVSVDTAREIICDWLNEEFR